MSILGAFCIAHIIALLFSPYRRQNWLMPLVSILLLAIVAGAVMQRWILPLSALLWSTAWLPISFLALILVLLFLTPSPKRLLKNASGIAPVLTTTSVFVWVGLFILLLAVIIGLYSSDALTISKMYYNSHLLSFL